MSSRACMFALCIALRSYMTSCSTISNESRAGRRMEVKITPDDSTNPKRVRFDLYRTPYANEQEQRLSVYERIRLVCASLLLNSWPNADSVLTASKARTRSMFPKMTLNMAFSMSIA